MMTKCYTQFCKEYGSEALRVGAQAEVHLCPVHHMQFLNGYAVKLVGEYTKWTVEWVIRFHKAAYELDREVI